MKPHSDQRRIYLNFAGVGEEGDDLVRRSFGASLDRLAEIEKKYDPDNQFRFNQDIPPAKLTAAELRPRRVTALQRTLPIGSRDPPPNRTRVSFSD